MIDIGFDFRTDTPPGLDPDAYSPTLHSYHKLLWSKPLPDGRRFDLDDGRPDGEYLVHHSGLGDFYLSSDAVVPSFGRRARSLVEQLDPGEFEAFNRLGYTIGGMMIFPANRVDGKMTINGARGFHPRIADRFDLTIECIRRHYAGEPSPLAAVLDRYADFLALFRDFGGYIEFFLLQDLVTDQGDVRFAMPFADFTTPAVPQDLAAYRRYMINSMGFLAARNARIAATAL